MEQFDALLRVAEKLLGPQGCPWDLKQTFHSLQPYVLEEAHEVIEAVDLDDDHKIMEELGDLLYTVIFYGKLAEKTGRFTLEHVLIAIKEKLIRRHPHIFGDVKVDSVDEVISNWEKIKAQEAGVAKKIDDIPQSLPGLVRGQKIVKKLHKMGFALTEEKSKKNLSEKELGERLVALLVQACDNDIDAESSLRRALNRLLERFHQ